MQFDSSGVGKELKVGLHSVVTICTNSSYLTGPLHRYISSPSSSVFLLSWSWMMELRRTDVPSAILIKDSKCLPNFFFTVAFIFLAIIVRNSGKSMVPLPLASTSLIISCNLASVGFWPSDPPWQLQVPLLWWRYGHLCQVRKSLPEFSSLCFSQLISHGTSQGRKRRGSKAGGSRGKGAPVQGLCGQGCPLSTVKPPLPYWARAPCL